MGQRHVLRCSTVAVEVDQAIDLVARIEADEARSRLGHHPGELVRRDGWGAVTSVLRLPGGVPRELTRGHCRCVDFYRTSPSPRRGWMRPRSGGPPALHVGVPGLPSSCSWSSRLFRLTPSKAVSKGIDAASVGESIPPLVAI